MRQIGDGAERAEATRAGGPRAAPPGAGWTPEDLARLLEQPAEQVAGADRAGREASGPVARAWRTCGPGWPNSRRAWTAAGWRRWRPVPWTTWPAASDVTALAAEPATGTEPR